MSTTRIILQKAPRNHSKLSYAWMVSQQEPLSSSSAETLMKVYVPEGSRDGHILHGMRSFLLHNTFTIGAQVIGMPLQLQALNRVSGLTRAS